MGIFVSEGVLPSGIPVSNVYMSFSGSIVYIEARNPSDMYIVRSFCKVFKDQESKLITQPDITFQVVVSVSNVNIGVFTCLYEKLKGMFPASENVIDIAAPQLNYSEDKYPHWIDLLNSAKLYISEHPGNTDLENAYDAAENSLMILRSTDTTDLEHLETLYNSLI
jgi:hypothetical protein